MEHYKVDDIDRACMAFPNLNFEIVHGGMAFLEETAWQLARFPNVYVNLEITCALAATRPGAFLHAMAALLGPGGASAVDRILWGTGAMAFHPQPLLETFVREFAFPEPLVASTGLPQIDRPAKRKILFENYARTTGLDLQARLEATRDDGFARRRRAGPAAPFSTSREPVYA
jgi:predicted TIM-barrel fold metal-dependent hydrolase